MPILNIELVGHVPDSTRDGLARRIAEAAADTLESAPHRTWVKLHFLEENQYSENGGAPEDGARPVIVSVLLSKLPNEDDLSQLAAVLADRIAKACNRSPQNVHLMFEPPAAGRIAFGGQLHR